MIRTVSCIGIGAVGAIYAWRLSEYLGYAQVRVVVDERRKERYERDGIFLNGNRISYTFVTPQECVQPADLVLIATKNHHLLQAMEDIASHVGSHTTFLSLLNGIDSERELSQRFSPQQVLYGFTTALDSTRIGNRIDFSTEGIIHFGEKDNTISERVSSISDLFTQAHISYVVPENIERELWAKYMVNVSINTLSALMRATYGPCTSVVELKELIIDVQREVIALAKEYGIVGLDESYIDHYQKIFASLDYGGKTSMLQDVEAKRPTEHNWFCVRASALARQLAVKTPLIDALARIFTATEAVYTRSRYCDNS